MGLLGAAQIARVPAVVGWLLVFGVVLSVAQQFAIRDEVFVSGDGGIKALVAKQFARGEWHADLRLPGAPWVEDLWEGGYYPFGPPFAYEREGRWFVSHPLPFMVATAPFYGLFGFRGLTILPLLGLWLLWFSVAASLGRFGVSPAGSAVSLGGLIFCSFVTPYGAMYWEHAPALGVSFLGFAVLVGRSAGAGRTLANAAGGVLLGMAVWLRPESAAFAVGVLGGLVVLERDRRGVLVASVGVGVACLAFVAFNSWVYGDPLGVHAIQEIDPLTAHMAQPGAVEIGGYFLEQLLRYCPVLVVLLATVLVGTRSDALRLDRSQGMLWGIVGTFVLGTMLIVPNNGGTQLGARYFLHALPPLFLLLGITWDLAGNLARRKRQALCGVIALGLSVGLYLNAVRSTQAIFLDYGHRTLPALRAIRQDPNEIIVVEHQWLAQGLAGVFGEKVFFRARNQAELGDLARELLERERHEFTLLRLEDMEDAEMEIGDVHLRMQSLGRFGLYVLVRCEIVSTNASPTGR